MTKEGFILIWEEKVDLILRNQVAIMQALKGGHIEANNTRMLEYQIVETERMIEKGGITESGG